MADTAAHGAKSDPEHRDQLRFVHLRRRRGLAELLCSTATSRFHGDAPKAGAISASHDSKAVND
eukprot:scaffold459_cov249-Pinguiococcus_pyrenoidosus.AAC.6